MLATRKIKSKILFLYKILRILLVFFGKQIKNKSSFILRMLGAPAWGFV
jgi:hypothetical protein